MDLEIQPFKEAAIEQGVTGIDVKVQLNNLYSFEDQRSAIFYKKNDNDQ